MNLLLRPVRITPWGRECTVAQPTQPHPGLFFSRAARSDDMKKPNGNATPFVHWLKPCELLFLFADGRFKHGNMTFEIGDVIKMEDPMDWKRVTNWKHLNSPLLLCNLCQLLNYWLFLFHAASGCFSYLFKYTKNTTLTHDCTEKQHFLAEKNTHQFVLSIKLSLVFSI